MAAPTLTPALSEGEGNFPQVAGEVAAEFGSWVQCATVLVSGKSLPVSPAIGLTKRQKTAALLDAHDPDTGKFIAAYEQIRLLE